MPETVDAFSRKDLWFADGWRTLGLEESIIDRYERPKCAWEAVLEPVA